MFFLMIPGAKILFYTKLVLKNTEKRLKIFVYFFQLSDSTVEGRTVLIFFQNTHIMMNEMYSFLVSKTTIIYIYAYFNEILQVVPVGGNLVKKNVRDSYSHPYLLYKLFMPHEVYIFLKLMIWAFRKIQVSWGLNTFVTSIQRKTQFLHFSFYQNRRAFPFFNKLSDIVNNVHEIFQSW